MSFFDNLKKTPFPPKPPQPPQQPELPPKEWPVIYEYEKQIIAMDICDKFKSACSDAHTNGASGITRRYSWILYTTYNYYYHGSADSVRGRSYYAFSESESLKIRSTWFGAPARSNPCLNLSQDTWFVSDYSKYAQNFSHMKYSESHRIMMIVNELLKKDGFPADTAKLVEKRIETEGAFFNRVADTLYHLELKATWR